MAIQRDICPQCGKNVGLVRIHKCVPVEPVTESWLMPATKAVAAGLSVTPAVTQCAECERLKAEIGTLKAQLVEALKGMPKPMTAAERMRRMRAARAQESDDAS